MAKKVYWHVTSVMNVEAILHEGIDPFHATTEIKRCWYVRWWGIAWALAHISMKKRIPIWQLVAFRVHVDESDMTHFNRNVYTCKKIVKARWFMSAERALSQWEKQRVGKGNAPGSYRSGKGRRSAMSREPEAPRSSRGAGASRDLDSSTAAGSIDYPGLH